MSKKSPEAAFTPKQLKIYEEELIVFFGGTYPEKLLVKGERIIQLRAWIGKQYGNGKPISQKDLAEKAGLNVEQSTINRYETKYKEVPTLHLWAIARSNGIPLHDIAYTNQSLPVTTSTSSLHRAKILILKSWLVKTLPQDSSIDLKAFVEDQWDDRQFNDMISLTKTQRTLLWLSLAQDGWLTKNDQGQFFCNADNRIPPTITTLIRIGHVVSSLFFETVTVPDPAYGSNEEHRNAILFPLSEGLKTINSALESTDFDIDACLEGVRDCDLAFSTNDQVATNVTLLYHTSFSQWVDVVWAFVVAAKSKEEFTVTTMITPVIQAMYDHRLALFVLLGGDPANLQQSGAIEQEYRGFVIHYHERWKRLQAHLAKMGLLAKPNTQKE